MIGWFKSTFAALEVREFRVLWLGGLASFVAFFMAMIVQSVVAFGIAGNNKAVGWVVFGQGFAMAALGPIGGAFADRWPKRRVIAVAQGVSTVIFATLAWLMATENLDLTRLAVGSTLLGATLAFLGPARQGLVVDVVPIERRGNAMAISNIANTGARVLGPAIAGVLLVSEWSGPVGAYLAMSLLYAMSALSLLLLPKSVVRPGARERPVFGDIVDGGRYIATRLPLLLLMTFFVAVILAGFPHVTVLPGLVENVLGRPASEVSQLFVASAVGALTASIAVARFGDSPRAHLIYTALGCLFGAALLLLAVAGSFAWLIIAMVGVGAGSGGFQSLNGAVIARQTEPAYMGRVMSLVILAFAGFGLMALPYGVLADWIGERQTLFVMGVAVLALCAALGPALARQRWGAPPGTPQPADSAGELGGPLGGAAGPGSVSFYSMRNRTMSKAAAIAATLIAAAMLPGSALAEGPDSGERAREYGAKTFDVLLLRPLGVAGMLIGAGCFIPTALITAPNGKDSFRQARAIYITDPYEFLFKRPLGEW